MRRTAVRTSSFVRAVAARLLWGLFALLVPAAQAQLFSDDEARKAILALRAELRSKITELETQRLQSEQAVRQDLREELRRQIEVSASGQLELVRQIERLRVELAELRGAIERASQTGSQTKSQQRDLFLSLESQLSGIEKRIAVLEPQVVKIDSTEVLVPAAEKTEFEGAQSLLRGSDLAGAARAFTQFRRQYPGSRLMPWVLHAVGNTGYALSQHASAIEALDELVTHHPTYPRLADAMLTLAASQAESKKLKEARATLVDLRKRFPDSEQAALAAQRLKSLPSIKK